MARQGGVKVIARNRRARHDYELLDRYEAGLALTGSEIKSIRANKVSLQRSFVQPRDGELWLLEANIAPYEHAGYAGHSPNRPRKLLLHRRQIHEIIEALTTKGLTMVPTKLYLKDGWAKVEVALARGKKQYDKRRDLAKKDAERQIERALRRKYGF
ncbi:MAG: SsrA-binding protein SmpB [Candidatus Promineifilaceae bacterium]|nr:SsrA-binding protein SmpB [Candidatus Promineifilaceae bacterium]